MGSVIRFWLLALVALVIGGPASGCGSGSGDTEVSTPADVPDSGPMDTPDTEVSTPADVPDSGPMDTPDTEEPPDPEKDTDRDGVPDLQEIAEGTDPLDPSSASAWQPEIVDHPRLFFGPEHVAEMAARANATQGPWATILTAVENNAAQTPKAYPPGDYDGTVTQQWGRIAESAALLGLIRQDPVLTQKALDVLSASFPDATNVPALSNYNLHEGEGLQGLCTAWDTLAGNPLADPGSLDAARERLTMRVREYHRVCHEGEPYWLLVLARNNHTMKTLGTLGLCALALNHRPDAPLHLSEAMTGLDFLMNHFQSTADGGYAEGWNYLTYGAKSFLPFMAAYHRYAQGETLPYFGVPDLQMGSPHANLVVPIKDFAVNERTRTVFLRALGSVQPDGLMPPTDDANPTALHGPLLHYLLDEDDFLWQWFLPAANHFFSGTETASFALYDGSLPPPGPDQPLEGAWHDAGFAVFRDGWGSDATYLVLQGEHGTARINGLAHEHADELSFLLWAHGRPLVIDPGYIDWKQHDLVKYSTDHNTILVDGKGAPAEALLEAVMGVDAFLGPLEHQGSFSWVAVDTVYEETAFKRRMIRTPGSVFVVEDRIEGDGQPRTYSWLLNGLGGGDVPASEFSTLDDGARWVNGGVTLDVRVVPLEGTALVENDLQEHATSHGKWGYHERLQVHATMESQAGFLSVLVPSAEANQPPAIQTAHDQEGLSAIRIGETQGLVAVLNRTGSLAEPGLAGAGGPAATGLTLRILDAQGTITDELVLP